MGLTRRRFLLLLGALPLIRTGIAAAAPPWRNADVYLAHYTFEYPTATVKPGKRR